MITLGSVLATNFGQWFFYQRKHTATATGLEINNDRTEIENLKLITQEWREAAQAWKDMADEYQTKHIENSRRVDELGNQVHTLKRELAKARKRIETLEKDHEALN